MPDLNFRKKIIDVSKILKSWQHRKLTLLGKVTVIKTLALPKLIHLLTSLPNLKQSLFNDLNKLFFNFIWDGKSEFFSLQKEKILELSKIFSNSFWKDVFYSLYLAKPLVKLNIKECLSLDLLNFVSIDDFPFYMRWGNAGVTSLNHIMDTVTKNFLTYET